MEKEPWEEDVYDNGEDKLKRTKKFSALNADRLLTILTIIFCILVVAVVCFLTYLSTGGSNRQTQMEGFYGTSAASSSSEASSTAEQPAANTTESSEGTLMSSLVKVRQLLRRVQVFLLPSLNSLTLLICPLVLGMPIQVML